MYVSSNFMALRAATRQCAEHKRPDALPLAARVPG